MGCSASKEADVVPSPGIESPPPKPKNSVSVAPSTPNTAPNESTDEDGEEVEDGPGSSGMMKETLIEGVDEFGPGRAEATRYIKEILAPAMDRGDLDPDSIVLDANTCFSNRRYTRYVKVAGVEEESIPSVDHAPLALMIFKLLATPKVHITAYQSYKVLGDDTQIDHNGNIWSITNSWRVMEYEKCEDCEDCRHKGHYFPSMDDSTEPHIYTIARAIDELRETVPCVMNMQGYTTRLFKHYKEMIDLAFIVANFAEMKSINLDIKLPFCDISVAKGVFSSSRTEKEFLPDFVDQFCRVVNAILKDVDSIDSSTSSTGTTKKEAESLLAEMYTHSFEYGTEDAYAIMICEHVGCRWWSSENISDENMYNLSRLRGTDVVKSLRLDWDAINTNIARKDSAPKPIHLAGRLDGTIISNPHTTRFGEIRVPRQPEYLRLDAENEVDILDRNNKRVLLFVNENGALVATTRAKRNWGRFKKVARGIGIGPVTLEFDFSSLGEQDLGGTDVFVRIVNGHYGTRGLRFFLEMTHKGRLKVNRHSSCKSCVPESCLADFGVNMGQAIPAIAFESLVFCCKEDSGSIDTKNIFWKPTRDGNLFHISGIKMNMTKMKETRATVKGLKACQMRLAKDVGH